MEVQKTILEADHETTIQTVAADPTQVGDSTFLYLKHISYFAM